MQKQKYNWPLAEGIKARLSDSGFGMGAGAVVLSWINKNKS